MKIFYCVFFVSLCFRGVTSIALSVQLPQESAQNDAPLYRARIADAVFLGNNNESVLTSSLSRRTAPSWSDWSTHPGLGIEFECQRLTFDSDSIRELSDSDFANLKGRQIMIHGLGQASRLFWMLTAEHVGSDGRSANRITTEFIIDGRRAKLGTPSAEENARDVAKFLTEDWRPIENIPPPRDQISVKGFEDLGYWSLQRPAPSINNYAWLIQATAPMPLSQIWHLFATARGARFGGSLLLSDVRDKRGNLLVVRQEHLRPWLPGGENMVVSEDLLGFLSLVVSYTKGAVGMSKSSSPKMINCIMPRTDFTTMYRMVSGELRGILGCNRLTFENLIRFLCMFELGNSPEERDHRHGWDLRAFTNGELRSVRAQLRDDTLFEKEEYGFKSQHNTLLIKTWLKEMPTQDALRTFDRVNNDGQVGALGARTEGLLRDTSRQVPIFEFRDLDSAIASQFGARVEAIRNATEKLHVEAPRIPTHFKRSTGQALSSHTCPADCPKGQAETGKNGKCEKCKQGYEPSEDQKKCIKQCAKDEARTGKNGQCVKCKEGYVPSSDQKSCQKKCPAGQAGSGQNGKCQKCKDGEEASADNKQCLKKCPRGTVRDAEGKCRVRPRIPKPKHTESSKPEPTETHRPHRTESRKPEQTESHKPYRTETHAPESTESHRPHRTESRRPEQTHSKRPQRTGRPKPPPEEPEQPSPNKPPPKQPPQSPMQPATHGNGGHGNGGRGRGGHDGASHGGGGAHTGFGSAEGEAPACPAC